MIEAGDKEKILQADFANIVRKVKAGKTLSSAERKIIDEAKENEPPVEPEEEKGTRSKPTDGQLILWTINALNVETGMDRRTIRDVLAKVQPVKQQGKSALYHMRDFFKALTSRAGGADDEAALIEEQTRLTKAKATREEIALRKDEGELVSIDALVLVISTRLAEMRRIVQTSPLPVESQDRMCLALADCLDPKKLMLENEIFAEEEKNFETAEPSNPQDA